MRNINITSAAKPNVDTRHEQRCLLTFDDDDLAALPAASRPKYDRSLVATTEGNRKLLFRLASWLNVGGGMLLE